MIYIDWTKCSHWEKIIYPLLGTDWTKALFSSHEPDSIDIQFNTKCVYCGAIWNEYTKQWEAPLLSRLYEGE